MATARFRQAVGASPAQLERPSGLFLICVASVPSTLHFPSQIHLSRALARTGSATGARCCKCLPNMCLLGRPSSRENEKNVRVLISTAHSYIPQTYGGVQSSTHDLATGLIERGHEVWVLCQLIKRGTTCVFSRAQIKLRNRSYVRDLFGAYPIFRTWAPLEAISDIIDQYRPDCAIVQSMDAVPMARTLTAKRTPTIFYMRNIEFDRLGGDPRSIEATFISNSHFTADALMKRYGLNSYVVPPLVQRKAYECEARKPAVVTFINPITQKGLEVALASAAACPEIPFEFVEAWPLGSAEKKALAERLCSLPNVQLRPGQTDMKSIYARTKILLAPSQWEEAWGRVATEAQINGIPVIASRIGGLSEAVGQGGILLSPDAPVHAWVEALRALWQDSAYFQEMSSAALDHSRRQEIQPAYQIEQIAGIMEHSVRLREGGEVAVDLTARA